MPIGIVNLALAALILSLKGLLLPRTFAMPAFACYLAASMVTTAAYLLGWYQTEAAWLPTVSVLGIAAAVECTRWTLALQSHEERDAVSKWCVLLGLVTVSAAMINHPITYPKYPTVVYELRLYAALFSIGYLVAWLGYCFVLSAGVPRYVIHASMLLLRLMTMGALLLVPHEWWFQADLIGSVVNALTLLAWLFLLPRVSVKPAVQEIHDPLGSFPQHP